MTILALWVLLAMVVGWGNVIAGDPKEGTRLDIWGVLLISAVLAGLARLCMWLWVVNHAG